jgi:hypothetical protein
MTSQEIAAAIGLFVPTEQWSKDDYRRYAKAEEIQGIRSMVISLLQTLTDRFLFQATVLRNPMFLSGMLDPEIDVPAFFKTDLYTLERKVSELSQAILDFHAIPVPPTAQVEPIPERSS